MSTDLSPENESLRRRVQPNLFLDADTGLYWQIDNEALGELLDAARAEGRAQANDAAGLLEPDPAVDWFLEQGQDAALSSLVEPKAHYTGGDYSRAELRQLAAADDLRRHLDPSVAYDLRTETRREGGDYVITMIATPHTRPLAPDED